MTKVSDKFPLASFFTAPVSSRSVAQQQVEAYRGARAFVRDRILERYESYQVQNYGRVLLTPQLTDESQVLMTYKGMESARNSACSLMGTLSSASFKQGYRLLFNQYIIEDAEELNIVEGTKRRHIDFKLVLPERTYYFSVKTTTRERAPNAWRAELSHLKDRADNSRPWVLVGVFYEAGLDLPLETIQSEIEKVQLDVDPSKSGHFTAIGLCDVDAHVCFMKTLLAGL